MNLEAKNPNNAYGLGQIKLKGGKSRAMSFLKPAYKEYKAQWIEAAKEAMGDRKPSDKLIYIKSTWEFGTRRKKDVQNCGKLEFDALQDVVYFDDSQIVMEEKYKVYSKGKPRITLEIYEVENYDGWEV
jgi:Holliday junction resolvase RusA-like endonuclease